MEVRAVNRKENMSSPYRLRIFISSIAVRRLCSRPGRSTEDRCRLPLRREDISSFQCPLATSVTRPMTTSPVAGAKRIWSGRTRNSLSTCSNIPHMCDVSLPWTNWTPWPRRKLSPEPKPSSVSPGARNDELVSLPAGWMVSRGSMHSFRNQVLCEQSVRVIATKRDVTWILLRERRFSNHFQRGACRRVTNAIKVEMSELREMSRRSAQTKENR